jgi:quercetin dioxygenase-like cupin family protein
MKQPLVVPHDPSAALRVLGADVRFLCEAEHTATAFSLMEVLLPLGAGPPPHHHDWDEAYYVADGRVRFLLGDTVHEIGAGDFIYAPGGTVHGFSGLSDPPARVLILDAPAHAAGFFREAHQAVRQPEDGPLVPKIGLRHGIHFLPPAAPR